MTCMPALSVPDLATVMPPDTIALLTRMPALAAWIVPLSTMAPLVVLDDTLMPVGAVIVPALVMPPVRLATPSTPTPPPDTVEIVPRLTMLPETTPRSSRWMPVKAAPIVPVLLMLPRNVLAEKTKTPVSVPPEIVPLLRMPPANSDTDWTPMPVSPAEIVPALMTPPAKPLAPETRIPLAAAEMAPALLMPPAKVEVLPTMTAVWPALSMPEAAILMPLEIRPPLVIRMPSPPAEIAPLSTMAPLIVLDETTRPVLAAETRFLLTMLPLVSVLLVRTMPPAPIVPALMMLPLKVVALTSISLAMPLKVTGYGPV